MQSIWAFQRERKSRISMSPEEDRFFLICTVFYFAKYVSTLYSLKIKIASHGIELAADRQGQGLVFSAESYSIHQYLLSISTKDYESHCARIENGTHVLRPSQTLRFS